MAEHTAGGAGEAGGALGEASAAPSTPKVRKARRKTDKAANALRRAEALSEAGAGALAELDALRRTVEQLTQGLRAIVETQATHTELLGQVLLAAAGPTDEDHRLHKALEQLTDQLFQQGDRLVLIRRELSLLPAAVGSAVAHEMASALAQVR